MGIINTVFWKNFLAPVCYGVSAYFSISCDLLGTLFLLMTFDMICGVFASVSVKEKYSNRKMLGGFFSKVIMLILPLTLALLGRIIGVDASFIVKMSIGVMAFAESISIIENLLTIRQKKRTESHDVMTKFLNVLSKNLEKKINKSLDEISGNKQ